VSEPPVDFSEMAIELVRDAHHTTSLILYHLHNHGDRAELIEAIKSAVKALKVASVILALTP
jgi:undecaprenyl pyrophosphate synthase